MSTQMHDKNVNFRAKGREMPPGYGGLRVLGLLALLLTGLVVVLGAYTRLVDAGLGCPDWPGCYGFLTVPQSEEQIRLAEARFPDAPVEAHKGWPEMIHRYAAGSLLLTILALTLISVRRRPRPPVTGLSVALLALVIGQALFGMWTVTLKLWPQVVTAHLLGGFAVLSLLLLWNLRLVPRPLAIDAVRAQALRRLFPWTLAALGLVILQISLGGWTSSNYAAMACPDLPTCQEKFWPAMDFAQGFNLMQHVGPNYLGGLMDNEARVAIHVTHRIGALAVLLSLGALLWRLRALAAGTPLMWPVAGVALALVAQILIGIGNILWLLPLPLAVAHNAGGALFLLSVVWLCERIHAAISLAAIPQAATPQEQEGDAHESDGTVLVRQ